MHATLARSTRLTMLAAGLCLGSIGAHQTHAADFIAAINSTNDSVVLLDATTGDLVNSGYILDANDPNTYNFSTPRGIAQVGNEVWITEQLGDAIYRFSATLPSTYIGRITTGVDNVRGICFFDGKVYVANAGNQNGAPGPAILVFNPDGSFVSSFATPDPYDVAPFNGKLLVTDINGDDILLYNLNGTLDSTFHTSDGITGIDFPQQLDVVNTGSGGAQEVWAAGFTPPGGIYRYNASGAQVAYYAVSGGSRGVRALSSDVFIYTDGDGLFRYTISTGADDQFLVGSFQGTGRITIAPTPTCDTIDFNNDTLTPDAGDLDDFIAVLGGGPSACSTFPTPGCNDLDFNNDGFSPDSLDLDAFISRLGGGPCLQ